MAGVHLRHAWFVLIFGFCALLVLANVVHYVLFRVLKRKETGGSWHGWGLQEHLGRPARAIFLLTCVLIALPFVPAITDRVEEIARQVALMALVASLGWFAIGCIYVAQSVLLRKYDLQGENKLQARRVHTQFLLFRRLAIGFVVVVTIGGLLWTFNDPRIWHYGSGLLASAGVASLILATAAKSTASNVLAGLQIALTEPIRIDDVVIVKGEFGRIEEITSAYVVIKVWDLRRLIVPLTYFIENSFENWTRESTDLLGTAFLYVDYTIPVEELRSQLEAVVRASPLWDQKACRLQVTNLTDRSMELRCMVSAANASDLFELRCVVREGMTAWIRERYPESFPRTRFAALPGEAGEQGGTEPPVVTRA